MSSAGQKKKVSTGKYLIPIFLVVLLAPTSVLMAQVKKNQNPETINIADQPAVQWAPHFVAKNKGWYAQEFAKDGIRVNFTKFLAGPPMIESFASGGQDIGFIGDAPPIFAKAENIGIRVFAIANRAPKAVAILLPANSAVKSIKDLKGKKIAAAKGSNAYNLLLTLLSEVGLGKNDVQIVHLLPPDGKLAFEKGDVDVWAVWTPWIEQVTTAGTGRVLKDATGYLKGLTVTIYREDFARKSPHLVHRFLNVLAKSRKWIEAHPIEAQEILGKDLKLQKEVLAASWKNVSGPRGWDPKLGTEEITELQKVAAFLKKEGLIRRDIDVAKELVDPSYTK